MTTSEPLPATTLQQRLIFASLLALTALSTLYVGAGMSQVTIHGPADLLAGWPFALPLMAILIAHEFGHYIAARRHRVDASLPYFIPMPVFLLGTLGAVINMRARIRSANALLDVGAAGPLSGLAIAVPVLIAGIATSPVEALPAEGSYLIEGRSLLYLALLHLIKGPIPTGHDIMLNPTAFAGWAGLLITMINLLPVAQLDGGHIAYALFGRRQDRITGYVHALLLPLALGVGLFYAAVAWSHGQRGSAVWAELTAGTQWLTWAVILWLMRRAAGPYHPPVDDPELSPLRKRIAIGCLVAFGLLFMPSWLRTA